MYVLRWIGGEKGVKWERRRGGEKWLREDVSEERQSESGGTLSIELAQWDQRG
jgi:hypothetical protein